MGARVIFEPSLATISATSASARARHFDVDVSRSRSIWNIRDEARSFLLTTVPIFKPSASDMNCRFSTSAMVFFTPNSLAARQVRILDSLLSEMAMNASASVIPASLRTSVSRASAFITKALWHCSDSLRHFSRSGSSILKLNLSPAIWHS